MPMSPTTLADALKGLAPSDNEATAIQNLVDAYATFASEAQALTPILPTGVDLGKAAMSAALVGMSAPGAGLTVIPAAIVAFWAAVAGGLASSFALATAIVPPPNAGLPGTFPGICAANTAGNLPLDASVAAIAADWYAQAIIGGLVTTPGGPPIVTPIL